MKHPAPAANCATVQRELKAYRDSLGKITNPVHYQNEIRLMRFALTAKSKTKFNFAHPPPGWSGLTRQVICLNRRLIRMHVPYKSRKQACREFVLKQLAKGLPQAQLNTNNENPLAKSSGTENEK